MSITKMTTFSKSILISAILLLFTFPANLFAQNNYNKHPKLTEIAIKNYRVGLQSEIYGIKMSCLYFAGKYKIDEVSEDLIKLVKNSDNYELCQMAIWSLYEIGDENCCKELEKILSTHPSERIRNSCQFLGSIRKYALELTAKDG